MKLKMRSIILFVILIVFSHQKIYSQCFEIESILVDACDTGSDEGLNEMVRFKVGTTDINTSNLSVNWPSNSWKGLVQNATTASKVTTLNAQIAAAGGCSQLIEPTGGMLPANAKVILVTSYNFNVASNYFGAITENIYIIFQNNATNTGGHFANYNTTSGFRTLTMNFGGGCSDSVAYQRTLLTNINGTYGPAFPDPTADALNNGATVNFTPSGTASYVNNGCVAPVEVFSVDAGNSPISACAGATVSLLGTAQGQQSVEWSASSGSFSSSTTLATNYTIDPAATGSITLTLKATNSCGVDKTDTVIVNSNAGASPMINCGTTTSSSIQFDWAAVSGATGYSVSYQVGTGTPTSFASIGNVLNYTVNGLASGTNVTITVLPLGGSGTCFVSSSKMCSSNGCIPPVLAITNPSPVCSPATVDITSASVTAGSSNLGTLTYWENAAATIVLANPSAIATSGTYYIKSTNGSCSDIKAVTVTINLTPVLLITDPSPVCSSATVDITSASVTAGSSNLGTLTYWENAAATTVLANPSTIATSGTYYIKSTNGSCSDIKAVTVTINLTPVLLITDPSPVCSLATVDITSASVTAGSSNLGTLTYWENAAATTVLANPSTIATSGTYYIKSTNGSCSDIKAVTVTIITNQATDLVYYLCTDKAGQILAPITIDTNLSPIDYTFSWEFNGSSISERSSSYEATVIGNYKVTATSLSVGCSRIFNALVKESKEATAQATVGTDFKNQQQIVVTVTGGLGNYEYQLDDGLPQSSPVFTISKGGEYKITVIDKIGCNNFTLHVNAINYPRFFTPNDDGYNDTWNIDGLTHPELAVVSIFDRYGKLLKQITPSGLGWDGKYCGKELPSSDYWFTLSYQENIGEKKEFKAHFSLKR